MIRLLLALAPLLLALSGPASAQPPNRLSFLVGSNHLDATREFHEVNPGLFLDWVQDDGSTWSLGVYHNSYGRTSVAGMAGLKLWQGGDTRLDLFTGVAYYPGDGRKSRFSVGDVVPLGGLRLEHRRAFLLAIPGDGTETNLVLGFGFSVPLER